jgi:transcriptional regulator with XRE-family HTH domain
MSKLSDRFKIILNELNVNQTKFAEDIGISFGYINMVVNGRRTSISQRLARLIEELYGYSADWLLDDFGEKKANSLNKNCIQNDEILERLKKLSNEELYLIFNYIMTFRNQNEINKDKVF